MSEEHEEEGWSRAEIVFGRLTSIDKDDREVTNEVREPDPHGEGFVWVTWSFDVSEDWSDEDFETLLAVLDKDIKLTIVDGTIKAFTTIR